MLRTIGLPWGARGRRPDVPHESPPVEPPQRMEAIDLVPLLRRIPLLWAQVEHNRGVQAHILAELLSWIECLVEQVTRRPAADALFWMNTASELDRILAAVGRTVRGPQDGDELTPLPEYARQHPIVAELGERLNADQAQIQALRRLAEQYEARIDALERKCP